MILKNPKFGNTWKIDTKVKSDFAAGGALVQVHDSQWPLLQSFSMLFADMDTVEKDSLENFLINTAGEEITMQDFEQRDWKGVFITDPLEFTITGPGCRWTITLDFEGYVL